MSANAAVRYRFVAKKIGDGRGAVWRVYDLRNGSYPYRTPELGEVLQDQSEALIRAEVERLHEVHGGLDLKTRRSPAAVTATVEPDDS